MPARPGVVEIGPESRIIIEYQDDNLTVFYLLEVLNNARTPIDIGGPLLIRLPTGAAGASMMQGSSPHASAQGRHADDHRSVPAGQDDRAGRILAAAGRRELHLAADLAGGAGAGLRRRRRRSATCRSSSPQLTDMREMNSDGQSFIMATGGRLNAGDTLVLNLTGLPAHSNTPRNAALIAALIMFAVGAWFALSPAKAHAAQDAKLHARREKLMNEVVALERKRRTQAAVRSGRGPAAARHRGARTRDRRARSRRGCLNLRLRADALRRDRLA